MTLAAEGSDLILRYYQWLWNIHDNEAGFVVQRDVQGLHAAFLGRRDNERSLVPLQSFLVEFMTIGKTGLADGG